MDRKAHFSRPITDVIKSRSSVRSYTTQELSGDLKKKIIEYSKSIKGPFDAKIRLEFIDGSEAADRTGGKIGTYGIIKGATTFIAGIAKKGDKDLEQLGYCLEELILYATSLGLGTCWLGGTFKRSEFARLVNLKEDEILPIVTPLGYPAEKRRVVDSFMRFAAGSKNRKQWSELFFNDGLGSPLSKEDAGDYKEALEMVRLGPSASNKQPWRIIKQGDIWHFYLKTAKGYGDALGYNIQRIDMGIALCHFEMTLRKAGINGRWTVDSREDNISGNEELTYIASWIQ